MAALLMADAEQLHAELSGNIEQVRKKMVHLGISHGLQHPSVLQCSKDLDLLLLEYYYFRKTYVQSQ